MKKAILFDLDNTLIDRQKAAYYLYRDLINNFYPEVNDSFLIECAIQTLINFDAFGHGNKIEAYKRINKMFNKDIDPNLMLDYWINNIGDYTIIFDGALNVCKKLKEKYKLGIVTNGARISQGAKLNKVPFLDYFDSIIVSGDLNVHKPNALPYLKCCEELDVEPNECIFIGDTFHTDLLGAYRLGMEVIWICTDQSRISDPSITRINDIKQLLDIL